MKKLLLAMLVGPFLAAGVAHAANVKVVSPNGGERLTIGMTHPITWNASGLAGKRVRLVLRRGGSTVGNIKTNLAADGSPYSWTVGKLEDGTSVDPGDNYKVRVQVEGQGPSDTSKGKFSIVSRRVVLKLRVDVLSPRKGTEWKEGEAREIQWKTLAKKGYRIDLYDEKGTTKVRNIHAPPVFVSTKEGTYSYRWTIQNDFWSYPGKYRVKVTHADTSGLSEVFHISRKLAEQTHRVVGKTVNKAKEDFHRKYVDWGMGGGAPFEPPLEEFLAGRPDPGPGKMRVGVANWWKDSDNWKYRFYRSHVFFDMAPYKGKGMLLSARFGSHKYQGCDPGLLVHALDSRWDGSPGQLMTFLDLTTQDPGNMTQRVTKWLADPGHNHGLLVNSQREAPGLPQSSTYECVGLFDDVHLELKFLEAAQ